MSDFTVAIAPWKENAAFVYSVTYDEATIDVLTNVYPIHQEYDMPGHVCAVSGYLGTERLYRGTSMREIFHMSAEQLHFLIARGWTVSSHSHSHPPTGQEGIDLDMEVQVSKWELEKATGSPVRLFTYWNDLALFDRILPHAKAAGYLGALSIGYPFNTPDFDRWNIARGTLGRDLEGWLEEPLVSLYSHSRDAFPGKLTREKTAGRWLVDITHIVAHRLPRACPESLWNRCSTPDILESRLQEVRALWGDRLWAAVPEAVLDYALMRRAARLAVQRVSPECFTCTVSLDPVPEAVSRRELTFRADIPWQRAEINRGKVSAFMQEGLLTWTAEARDGTQFAVRAA
ncbi:MAG: polysaccharide deacetylase family protein [Armatimonadetes bacterium]|nr:polysaccharide deacetylase family protein [Armatimonadota bacterium]